MTEPISGTCISVGGRVGQTAQHMYNLHCTACKGGQTVKVGDGRGDPAAEQNVQVNSWGEVGK